MSYECFSITFGVFVWGRYVPVFDICFLLPIDFPANT